MEEKYRKLAEELGIKINNNNLDEMKTTPSAEVRNANDYYEFENNKLKLKIKLLTDVIAEQREYTNMLEETKNDLEKKVIDLRIVLAKRDEEIETLQKIIDKCNTTYYNANEKTEVEENEFKDTTCFSYKDTGYGISFVHSINDLLLALIKDDLVYFDENNIIYDGEVVGRLGEDLYKTMKKISESDPDTIQMEEN